MQLITVDADEIGEEHNEDWMHVILIQNSRFHCHNLKDWSKGVPLHHLGLTDTGQPKNQDYYMRFLSRAYWIQLQPKTTARGTRGKRKPLRKQKQQAKKARAASSA
jgi:hypothetical protein